MPRYAGVADTVIQLTTTAVTKVRVQNIGGWPVRITAAASGASPDWNESIALYPHEMIDAAELITRWWPSVPTGIIWATSGEQMELLVAQ